MRLRGVPALGSVVTVVVLALALAAPTAAQGQPILRRGATGAAVRTLQARLNAWIARTPASGLTRLPVNGTFGPATERTVIAFQRANGLPQTGVVASLTWARLPAATGAAEPPSKPSPTGRLAFSGRGIDVTEVFFLPVASRVRFEYYGESNFIVWARNGENAELLANTVGDYIGSRWLAPGYWFLEIDGEGAWSIKTEPLGNQPAAATALDEIGDVSTGWFTPRTRSMRYYVWHLGDGNIIVWLRCRGGDELIVNEIGGIEGTVSVYFPSGPCFWDVQADSAWQLVPR